MAWIESHQELARHPKTRKLARKLGVSIPSVIGYLHLMWWWALDYAQDGDLSSYDLDDLADAMMYEGNSKELITALIESGFLDLDKDQDRLIIHDWFDYAGKLVEKRRIEAERKRLSRKRPADVFFMSAGRPADVDGNSTVPNSTKHNSTVPNKHTSAPADVPLAPEGAADSDSPKTDGAQSETGKGKNAPAEKSEKGKDEYSKEFEEFWSLYPRKIEKRAAYKNWAARIRDGTDPSQLVLAARNYAKFCLSQKIEERYIKHPSTFLSSSRAFEDYVFYAPSGSSSGKVKSLPEYIHRQVERDREEENIREERMRASKIDLEEVKKLVEEMESLKERVSL